MTDEEFSLCMQRMSKGDRDALREVYEAYLKLIYALCLSKLKHKESAEDVTSEFFIRLYNSAATYDGRGNHKAWISTIARNMCIDYIRKNSREITILDAPDEDGNVREVEDPGGTETGSGFETAVDNKLTLEKAMKILNEKEKQVINMKVAGGMTFKEISEALEMPQGTVSWHYNEAIKKLRRFLS
jgi:RNA polymerase sigma-70 factor (ECF subfamily)